ncbi:MAG: phage tail protein [Candidatus Zhuqueibacterota bacterium]
MKRIISAFIVCIMACTIGQTAIAQTLSIQGVLRDPLGRTVEDGAYSLTFRIYNAETGGTALWTETQGSVIVKHGVFSVELGKTTSMANLTFSAQYYIGISVEGGQELEPRIKMTNSPSSYGVFGVKNTFPSSGNVGVGVVSPGAGLHIKTQNAADNLLKIESSAAGGGAMTVDASGKIGLNVTPEQALDIIGNLKMRNGSIMFSDGSALSSAYFGGSASSLTNNGNVLITTDADDNGSGSVQVVSGAATVMTVANNGNVGIGPKTDALLHVSSTTTDAEVRIEADADNNNENDNPSIGFYQDLGTLYARIGLVGDAGQIFTGSKDNAFYLGTVTDQAVQVVQANSPVITVDTESNVGVGTTTPTAKLDVNGNIKVTDISAANITASGRIKDATGYLAPVGTIAMYSGSTAPAGWLICDGATVSSTTYADLYAVIGTTYGGTASSFALPNLKGRVPVGRDAGDASFNVLNEKGGEKTHAITVAEMPAHTHTVDPDSYTTTSTGSHTHTLSLGTEGDDSGSGGSHDEYTTTSSNQKTKTTSSDGSHTHTINLPSTTSSSAGSGTAMNMLQPYIVLNYIIKY